EEEVPEILDPISEKKQYNELDNIINTSKDIDELNKLKSIIESISFDELKEQIENINLSNVKKLLDKFKKDLESLKNPVINNKLLLKNQKDNILNLIKNKLDKTKEEERLQKETDRKYNTIEKNIDKFLISETLDKFIIENIDSLNEKYLTDEWKFEKWKKKVIPEFLNKFLDNFLQRKDDENLVKKNLDRWLKGEDSLSNQDKLREYSLIEKSEQKIKVAEIKNSKFTGNINKITISDTKVIEKKAELDKSLANSFAKIKDITVKLKKGGKLKLKIVDVDGLGILLILTDGGKITKVVKCLFTYIFPKKYIILIIPNEELAPDAENHHNFWLQYSN
ncbi:19120_t:CDS:2, partial [Cetraspora pellucida]